MNFGGLGGKSAPHDDFLVVVFFLFFFLFWFWLFVFNRVGALCTRGKQETKPKKFILILGDRVNRGKPERKTTNDGKIDLIGD